MTFQKDLLGLTAVSGVSNQPLSQQLLESVSEVLFDLNQLMCPAKILLKSIAKKDSRHITRYISTQLQRCITAVWQSHKKQINIKFVLLSHLLVWCCVLDSAVTFSPEKVSSTGRSEPKKSVIRTL
jgi:hypothetical protein